MKYFILVSLLSILAGSCTTPSVSPDRVSIDGRIYQLEWSDEFNNTGLPDSSNWRFETGFVRNHEVQYYTDKRIGNCHVENGLLHITAMNDSFEGHPVTSASIETKGLHNFKYGLIRVRAKMPHLGNGTWPAIWTVGINRDTVGWPLCGEMDIVEWVGKAPTMVLGSTFLPGANGGTAFRTFPYLVASPSILTDGFHDYAIEWDSTQVRYYFDNINYTTYRSSDLGPVSWAPLMKEHYLKLNLAMGGSIPPVGGGGPIDYSKFPYTFEIEYARYYKRVQ
jgi:beta-glucanase (GH16 family)